MVRVNLGGYKFDAALKTIIVVSHEASRKGAPILAWNIVERQWEGKCHGYINERRGVERKFY